ncbi:hypothetical protein [Henriciella sp.]|uniref:hypothetical protein n=1 Tax=Henriciella sp. TaxID=1968823 RepID=UPI00263891F9|nr:hypothetical protein [Henriciella sp.]
MPMHSSTSTGTRIDLRSTDQVWRADVHEEKWPLWKTYLFVLGFCTTAWAAIFMVIFAAI